jgi:hypothetical protein
MKMKADCILARDKYYKACRAQSGGDFLLIPSEEADIYLGGHWGLVFPHPV